MFAECPLTDTRQTTAKISRIFFRKILFPAHVFAEYIKKHSSNFMFAKCLLLIVVKRYEFFSRPFFP
jgi:hypothetical protein